MLMLGGIDQGWRDNCGWAQPPPAPGVTPHRAPAAPSRVHPGARSDGEVGKEVGTPPKVLQAHFCFGAWVGGLKGRAMLRAGGSALAPSAPGWLVPAAPQAALQLQQLQRGEGAAQHRFPCPALHPRANPAPCSAGPPSPSCRALLAPLLPAHPAQPMWPRSGWLLCQRRASPGHARRGGSGASEPTRCQDTGVGTLQMAGATDTGTRHPQRCHPPRGPPRPEMLLGTPATGKEPSPPTAGRGFVPVAPGLSSPGTGRTRRAPGSWIGATSLPQQWPDNSGKWPKMWV